MNAGDRTVAVEGGRKIHIIEAGKPDGVRVLVHPGTPGVAVFYPPSIKDAGSRGIRLISYDRPGYRGSTPQRGRTVASLRSSPGESRRCMVGS